VLTDGSYIQRSRQSWKFWLFVVALAGGGLALLIGFLPPVSSDPSLFVPLVLGSSCFVLGGLLWICISIKCRRCKSSFGWIAVRKKQQDNWFAWLITTDTCPVCGDQEALKK